MTAKQIEKLQKRIDAVKRALAAEKRKFGAHHDGGGLRYLPAKYYLQLEDYAGGLTYLKWFDRNFPDDGGFPDFLFEWTIILFKNGLMKAAEKKAFRTFCANTYLFDKFFGRPITAVEKWEGSNLAAPSFTDDFNYSSTQAVFSDFSDWLRQFTQTEMFTNLSARYIDINKLLLAERNYDKRHNLFIEAYALADNF